MSRCDYPVDLRVEYAEPRSRLWAVLTVTLVKLLALVPHAIVLALLGVAQLLVAFVAQLVVVVRGEYPEGMFGFVTGVLRWGARVSAFLYSLTDRYPPFSLHPDPDYPVDVVVERPPSSSRVYAAFTVAVQVAATAGIIWFLVWALSQPTFATSSGDGGDVTKRFDLLQSLPQPGGGLLLRQLAALPHLLVLALLGLAVLAVWVVVQWVILFTARYPRGLFGFVVGVQRWQVRVNAYGLGLTDRYPPFTFDPSLVASPGTGAPEAATPGAWWPDPTGRHELRYWDGRQWTGHVADGGVSGVDPLDGPAGGG